MEKKGSLEQEVQAACLIDSIQSNEDFTTIIEMPSGTHHLKFIVDDEWKCSEDLPTASDMDGNLINFLQVSPEGGHSQGDGLDDLSHFEEETGQTRDDSHFTDSLKYSESPPGSYSTEIPKYLEARDVESPEQVQEYDPPQTLPRYLEKVLLNHKSSAGQDPSILPIPHHVALNHLYACSIKDGIMAIGTTTRYRKKVTRTDLVHNYCVI